MPSPAAQPADVNDGQWHMLTVSTFPNGTRGYALFVDGAQVGGWVGGWLFGGEGQHLIGCCCA